MSAFSAALPPPSRGLSLLLGCGGIVILSPDALLLRLTECDDNAVVTLRALFATLTLFVLIAAIPALRSGFRWTPVLLYGGIYAVGLACFPLSIKNTHVANTLVIISAAPMIAAVGAYFVLRERTAMATWGAAAVIFFGMAAIFSQNIGSGGFVGDLLALFVAVSLAGTSIVVRRFPDTAVYSGLLVGGLINVLLFGAFADWGSVSGRDVAILAVDGSVVMTLSFLLLIYAARGLPPAEWNLLFLLETILGPLWVWMILNEVPPPTTVAAGVLIGVVLVLHTVWLLRRNRAAKRRGATPP